MFGKVKNCAGAMTSGESEGPRFQTENSVDAKALFFLCTKYHFPFFPTNDFHFSLSRLRNPSDAEH